MEIRRDAAASEADTDDYSVEPIVIEAGETTGTTTLMVTDDDLPDGGTGTNRGETLVLLGTVDGVEIGDLTFIIWGRGGTGPAGGRGASARSTPALARRGACAGTRQIAHTLNQAPAAGSARARAISRQREQPRPNGLPSRTPPETHRQPNCPESRTAI